MTDIEPAVPASAPVDIPYGFARAHGVVIAQGEGVGIALVVAILVSNLPESIVTTRSLGRCLSMRWAASCGLSGSAPL